MDKSILDNTRQNAALDKIRASVIDGDPGATLCVEFYGDRKEDLPPRLAALERDLRTRGLGAHFRAETDAAGQARVWSLREAALGLSMAMKEDAKSISVRRRHRRRSGKAERVYRPVPGDSARLRDHGGHLRARIGGMPARAAGDQSEERRRRPEVRSHRARNFGPGAGVRRRAFGRTWRRASAESVHAPDVRRRDLRSISRDQADLRPAGNSESGKDRRCASSHVESSFRREVCEFETAHFFRLFRIRRIQRRGGNVQRRGGVPERAIGDDVSFLHGDPRGNGFHTRASQRAAAGDVGTIAPIRIKACIRFWICAWSAARANQNARWASTWRDSRASFSRAIRRATERRCGRRRWEIFMSFRSGAAGSLQFRTGLLEIFWRAGSMKNSSIWTGGARLRRGDARRSNAGWPGTRVRLKARP